MLVNKGGKVADKKLFIIFREILCILVPPVRLELTHPQRAIDFESIASTTSATEA